MRRAGWVAAGLSPLLLAAAVRPESTGDLRAEAGAVVYDAAEGRYRLEGGAVVRRGSQAIRAHRALVDPATGEVSAEGDVLVVDETRAIAAERVAGTIGGSFEAEAVRGVLKEAPSDLARAPTFAAAEALGRNRMHFSSDKLVSDPSGHFTLLGARLTLCDCASPPPPWELRSRSTHVIPGRRAILDGPLLYVTPRFLGVKHPVPVLWLPKLYLPLSDRQSGFLLPLIASTSATGTNPELPLFLTLGESADLTLTTGYAFGPRKVTQDGAVRGLTARLEGRWAPAVGSEGRAELFFVQDSLDESVDDRGGEGGSRLALEGEHRQRLGERTSLAARLSLYGDPYWFRDFTSGYYERQAFYRRSSVIASHRRDAAAVEVLAAYQQPLLRDPLNPGTAISTSGYGTFGSDIAIGQRLPSVSAALLPLPLGPTVLEGHAGVARFAPLSGARDTAGRPAATRADARLQLSSPLLLGGISAAPFLRAAGAAYAFEDGSPNEASGWVVGGLSLSAEISRRFGSLRHALVPRVEWRLGGTASGGGLSTAAYDPFDRARQGLLSAAPEGVFHQLRGSIENRLGLGERALLSLEVGQDFDVAAGRFGESFVSGAVAAGPFKADGSARFLAIDDRETPAPIKPPDVKSALDAFTELRANASVGDSRGNLLRAGILSVGPGASGIYAAGIDTLFDLRPGDVRPAASAGAGARGVLGPATFGYDATFAGRPRTDWPSCSAGGAPRRVDAWHVAQHAASFAWSSPCRCWRLAVVVTVNDCGVVTPTATLQVAGYTVTAR